jgi:hypothetical protein
VIDEARASLVECAADMQPGRRLFERSSDPNAERAVDAILDWCRKWKRPQSSPDALAIFAPSLHRRRQSEAQIVDLEDLRVPRGSENQSATRRNGRTRIIVGKRNGGGPALFLASG